jgi:hypothetical protein
MRIYAYVDETEFYLRPGNEAMRRIGYGLLISATEIDDSVVRESLVNLGIDPDIQHPDRGVYDQRTLSRRYFHASEDSSNAHSHFCNAIRDGINWNFYYTYTAPQQDRSLEQTFRLALELVSTQFLSPDVTEVILTYENRDTFTPLQANVWLERYQNQMEYGIYEREMLPEYFPNIILRSRGKREPGLQVVDFLLWVMNRKNMQNLSEEERNTWYSGLLDRGPHFSEAHYEDNSITWGEHVLRREVEITHCLYPEGSTPIPEFVNGDAENCFRQIIDTIRQVHQSGRINQYPQLIDRLEAVLSLINLGNLGRSEIRAIASLYVRMFDTIPVYERNLTTGVMMQSLLKTKKIAAQLLHWEVLPEASATMSFYCQYYRDHTP